MSRVENRKIGLTPENVSLLELIEDAIDVFRPLVAEKRLELQISADRVRHEEVVTDQNHLQQVLMNLLSNAIKHTPERGGVSLRVREIPAFTKDGGQYEFIVTDNETGMPGDFIPHVFEPFSRTEESKTNRVQGAGLSMATTQNIVNMVNGTIEVKSILGEGSQFIAAVSSKLCEKVEDNNVELPGLPVLMADGDRVIYENAAEILDDLGMRSS